MSQFMLLLHENPAVFQSYTPEELQKLFERYHSWNQELANSGRLVVSAKLKDEGGKHLRRGAHGKVKVVDGPYGEAKEVIGGYFTVEAKDYDEAVEIASGCPHVEFGWIEIREVDRK
jgi:hypothetical protein